VQNQEYGERIELIAPNKALKPTIPPLTGPRRRLSDLGGPGAGHHLIKETSEDVVYLKVGDRTPEDKGIYPDDDLKALLQNGKGKFVHKDGKPY
jgi:hypothetical protein